MQHFTPSPPQGNASRASPDPQDRGGSQRPRPHTDSLGLHCLFPRRVSVLSTLGFAISCTLGTQARDHRGVCTQKRKRGGWQDQRAVMLVQAHTRYNDMEEKYLNQHKTVRKVLKSYSIMSGNVSSHSPPSTISNYHPFRRTASSGPRRKRGSRVS